MAPTPGDKYAARAWRRHTADKTSYVIAFPITCYAMNLR